MFFECSLDGTNWDALFVTPSNGAAAKGNTTGPGIFRVAVGGLALVRARLGGTVTGGITVLGLGTPASF